MATIENNPALTYTLDDFISMQFSDDMTYYNFSILEVVNGVRHLSINLVEEYLDILSNYTISVDLSNTEYNKYRYCPDLLAYDLYGTTQVDFVLMLLNDCVDPKEFNKRRLNLPYATKLNDFLNEVYSKESNYINLNRQEQGLIN